MMNSPATQDCVGIHVSRRLSAQGVGGRGKVGGVSTRRIAIRTGRQGAAGERSGPPRQLRSTSSALSAGYASDGLRNPQMAFLPDDDHRSRKPRRKTMASCKWMVPVLCWMYLVLPARGFDITQCRVSLGMQSGEIPDEAITSSSSYDPDSVGPENARIRTESKGGAWCPGQQVSEDVYEYLEIDLQQLKIISFVETQGRFGNGQGQEYADRYLLDYQREDNGRWFRFRNRRGQEIIQGNTNTYIAELREVDPPIIARRVRFIPYSNHPRTVCLRVELYGCPWKDGSVSYSMHQGERRGTEVDLYDFTYDGTVSDYQLTGGLGQLTDGELGESNFRLDPKGFGIKGYEWVGWRNESHNGKAIEITFKFDDVRNFSNIRIHANNMFSKDVRVFKGAKLYFSIGGEYFKNEPITYWYMRDTLIEYARQVTIPVPNLIGHYVKIQLLFDAKWMMISEIQFESEYAVGNFTPEVPPSTIQPPGASTKDANIVQVIDLLPNGKQNKTVGSRKVHPTYDEADAGGSKSTTTMGSAGAEGSQTEREKKALDEEYIGIIIGALAALILLLFLVIVIIIIRQRHRKSNNNHQALIKSSIVPRHVTLDLNDLQANQANEATLSREYAVPDITKSSFGQMRPNIPPPAYSPNLYAGGATTALPLSGAASHYAAADVVNIPNIQGVSGSNVYAVPNGDLLWTEDLSVMEFPRENLKFIEKLGEGQFGEVHLCEAQHMTDFLGDDFLLNRTSSGNSMLVAVKTLRRNADQSARTDFQKEVKIMSRIKDPNIVQVLGVCTRDDPLSVIVEYMKFGDLHQFLEQHVGENTTPKKKHTKTLSRGGLVYMATQIASGMKYLESLNMVHRDLATRNCLVGHNYCIKISDFGMSRNLYSNDYYRIEGKAVLPIRWMAWESILLGKFSCKSDVWSFAVTLWEILNLAKTQPFDNLTDEQVIENCGHYYRNDGLEEYLPQPSNCQREIYDLMKECWNREEIQRPTFREIHMFLQRKNMGYDPVQDQATYSTKGVNVPVV